MANIKSQKKRILTNEKSRLRNIAVKSRLKTYMKQANDAIAAKDADAIKSSVPVALRELDRASSKGILHSKTVARRKSHLQSGADAALKG